MTDPDLVTGARTDDDHARTGSGSQGGMTEASISALLVANRGEIAVRALRTARKLGVRGVAVYSQDDANSLHVRQGDEAIALSGTGPPHAGLEFMESLGRGRSVMLKAVAGSGGRGMRAVHRVEDLPEAFERCQSEASRAFGNGAVYAEELARIAENVRFDDVGTFEFLVDDGHQSFAFIEANPRLQVEHTVTEEVTGVDLVRTQLAITAGESLSPLPSASICYRRSLSRVIPASARPGPRDGKEFRARRPEWRERAGHREQTRREAAGCRRGE